MSKVLKHNKRFNIIIINYKLTMGMKDGGKFQILVNVKYDKVIDKFTPKKTIICNGLKQQNLVTKYTNSYT